MRTLSALLAAALAVAVCADPRLPNAMADEKGVGEGLAERIQDLNLTDDQEAKIADIRKEYRTEVAKAGKDLAAVVKEEVEKIRAVLTEEQKKTLQAAKKERRASKLEGLAVRIAHLKDLDLTDAEFTKITDIRKEYRPKIAKAMKQLGGILTDEQKQARMEALKAGKRRKEVRKALKLTDEQKEKVETVGKEVGTLVREELEQVRDLLTKEQKAELQEFKGERKERVRDRFAHRVANMKQLKLTDEQKASIMEIRKEYRPKVQEAGNKLRAAVREEVEKIAAVLKG
jgi:Spy/CpxP family protein refolding chaperone